MVYRCGGDKDSATKDHDIKLAAVLERCRSSGIALNKKNKDEVQSLQGTANCLSKFLSNLSKYSG